MVLFHPPNKLAVNTRLDADPGGELPGALSVAAYDNAEGLAQITEFGNDDRSANGTTLMGYLKQVDSSFSARQNNVLLCWCQSAHNVDTDSIDSGLLAGSFRAEIEDNNAAGKVLALELDAGIEDGSGSGDGRLTLIEGHVDNYGGTDQTNPTAAANDHKNGIELICRANTAGATKSSVNCTAAFVARNSSGTTAKWNHGFFCDDPAVTAFTLRDSNGDDEVVITAGGDIEVRQANKIILDGASTGTDHTYITEQLDDDVRYFVGNQRGMRMREVGNEVNIAFGKAAALATTATHGFIYIPGGAGAPTGTPASETGKTAMYYDQSGNAIYIYNGSWRSVSVT